MPIRHRRLRASLKKAKVESLLKLEGHRATKVQTLDQLSTVMSSGRFDVILTANSDSASVQRLIASAPDAAIVVGVDDLVKNRSLMQAIDKAVLQHDQNLKKTRDPRSGAVTSVPRLLFASAIAVLLWPALASAQAFTPPPRSGR